MLFVLQCVVKISELVLMVAIKLLASPPVTSWSMDIYTIISVLMNLSYFSVEGKQITGCELSLQESSVLATIFKREPKKKKEKKEKIQIDAAASMAEVPSVPHPAVMAPVNKKKSGKGKVKKVIDTVVPQPEEPDLSQPTVLAAIFDRKPGKKKYKKCKESEIAPPQAEEPSMSQPACLTGTLMW